jgi:hypothetical protein
MSRADREAGGLDDLFGFTDDPAVEEQAPVEEEKPPSRAGWVIRNALFIAIATLVAVAGLRAAGIGVSILIIVAAFIALRLLLLAVSLVAPPPAPKASRRGGEENGDYRWVGADSLRAAVREWEHRLDWAQSDPDRFSRNVLPVLAELTDERLRLRHGITRQSDPRRARQLIGEPLWLLLDDPGRRPPRPRDLATYVETLERL